MAPKTRYDGYVNMLTKAGTWKDSTEAYTYRYEAPTPDAELAQIYSSNGLFTRIIDKPAELAFKYGYDYGFADKDIEDAVTKKLNNLKWKTNGCTALKWARLFGGAAILMGVDDGFDWEEPVDTDSVRGVRNLVVFERPEIQPDYGSVLYRTASVDNMSGFGLPEFYYITPIYGGQRIKVHESRLLIFRNGQLPRTSTMSTDYMFFGSPEYNRIRRELKDTVTTHGNGYRLLERCVQAVYKMKNLSSLLATEGGEDEAVKRIQLIDMARSLLNTMIIDGDGEEFSFQSYSLPGVSDIINESCNMLSAVTNIPQTVLFGRSPAGENSTGESDLTNYYDFVGLIQETNVTDNLDRLVRIILAGYRNAGRIDSIPEYELTARPLWNMSELEQAQLDQARASAAATKAQTAQIYVDMQVLDASEIRKSLAESDDFQIDEILAEDDLLDDEFIEKLKHPAGGPGTAAQEAPANAQEPQGEAGGEAAEDNPSGHRDDDAEPSSAPGSGMPSEPGKEASGHGSFSNGIPKDDIIPMSTHGCGVYVIENGRILCGRRADGTVGGPGGYVEPGETPVFAAVRETMEEFGIVPKNLVQFGYAGGGDGCVPSTLFLCNKYIGNTRADGTEMKDAMWLSLEELGNQELFPAFEAGIEKLLDALSLRKEDAIIKNKINNDGDGDQPRDEGGRFAEVSGLSTTGLRNTQESSPDKKPHERNTETNLNKQSPANLKKGIRSLRERIREHEDKISNPKTVCPNWDNMSEQERTGNIRHWEKERDNFMRSIKNRIKKLEEMGEEYE